MSTEKVHFSRTLPGGLCNYGNTCYVNSCLQYLFSAESFCRELSHLLDNCVHKPEDTFLRYFVDLSRLRKSTDDQDKVKRKHLLWFLIKSAETINSKFNIYIQNDIHEFLCHCLNQIEESGRGLGWQEDVDPRCPVWSNFKFKMMHFITCSSCGVQRNEMEVFNHISVPLVHNSVDQCLYNVINNTRVLKNKCQTCGGEFASSRWMLQTLPRFLILQLNRFSVISHDTVIKLETPVDINPELQINCFPQSQTPGIENSKSEARQTHRNKLGGSASKYRLISVLRHLGSSLFSGHYMSECFSHSDRQWMTYNDELVTLTTERRVLEKSLINAYVLLYERVSNG